MTLTTPRARLVCALFDLTQYGENIDIFSVSEEAGLSVYQALATLCDLEQRGLCDARRLRLTLSGLAIATALTLASAAVSTENLEAGGWDVGPDSSPVLSMLDLKQRVA